jgi:hypothetical protein
MIALDPQNFVVLYLALDMLGRHAENELSKARKQNNAGAKQMAMIAMRQQIANVRVKLQAMELQS